MMRRGWIRLLLCSFAVAVIWLGVLPWLARQTPLREQISRNESAGIDPSALFYSDLEHLTYRDGMLRQSE